MTRFVACCLVSVLFATAVAAQTPPVAAPARANSLAPGAWAVQFQVENDFTLEPFNGTMISLKRQFTSHSALRLGVGLDLSATDEDEYVATSIDDTLAASRSLDDDVENQVFRLDLLYVRYPDPAAAVNWYWGAGPSMRYQHNESTSNGLYDDSRAITYHSQSESWSLGALGCLGAEWFAGKNVSLHAEYYVTLYYTESDSDQRDWRETRRTPHTRTNSIASGKAWPSTAPTSC
jgi:hypothetical protein